MALARGPGTRKNRERTKEQRITKQARAGKNTSYIDECRAVSPDKPLTELQRAFVKLRAAGEPPTNALFRAGFSESNPKYAYRLEAMPNIARALAAERAAYAKAAEISKKDVMDMLKEAYDMAKLMSEPASMVSAAREIGKMCGYYEPKKVDLTISTAGKRKVEQLSDEDLFKMIEEATAEVSAIAYDDGEDDTSDAADTLDAE